MNAHSQDFIIVTERREGRVLAEWNDLIANSEYTTHFVTPDYLDDQYAGTGKRFAVLAIAGGRIAAVSTGLLQGRKIVSGLPARPQTVFRYGTDRSEAARGIAEGMKAMMGSKADLVTIYSWEHIPALDSAGYEHDERGGSDQIVMLDLSDGPELIFQHFSAARRTSIRRCIKAAKLTVERLETESELAELYEVHKVWCARKGFAADDWELFKNLLDHDHRAVFLALYHGKIVAATYIRFAAGGVAEYAANNSLREYLDMHPNDLLMWRAIEWACSAGLRKFSLGGSHPFLLRFGGELVSPHRYRLDRTFGHRHLKKEWFERFVVRTYTSLPDPLRKSLKKASGR